MMAQLCCRLPVPKDVSDDNQAAELKPSCLNHSVQGSLNDTGAGGCSSMHRAEVILFIVLSVFWEDLKQWQLQELLQAALPHPWGCPRPGVMELWAAWGGRRFPCLFIWKEVSLNVPSSPGHGDSVCLVHVKSHVFLQLHIFWSCPPAPDLQWGCRQRSLGSAGVSQSKWGC